MYRQQPSGTEARRLSAALPDSPEPVYLRIERQLRRKAQALALAAPAGAPVPFPGDGELTRSFGVSRMTVRRAVEALVREGLLVRRRGVGTFVPPRKVEGQLHEIERFFNEWRRQGLEARAEVRVWTVAPCPEAVAPALGPAADEPVLRVVRLRFADGLPLALDERYIPSWAAGALTPEDVCRESVFVTVANRLGLHVTHADQELEARAATAEEAGSLAIAAGDPVLVRRVTIHARGRGPLLTGTSVYRADRFRYRVRVDHQPRGGGAADA